MEKTSYLYSSIRYLKFGCNLYVRTTYTYNLPLRSHTFLNPLCQRNTCLFRKHIQKISGKVITSLNKQTTAQTGTGLFVKHLFHRPRYETRSFCTACAKLISKSSHRIGISIS
ncbi:hypothetical protein HanXRQr2_Chr14g0629441 [Helianthus annuus]|uniref:Uncharacterized protein n=1 Tax=Helianthus annuus TaxID=4232 RepID=A0A9K3E6D8_HELAN|nr:hypothetical protein HanXRQr2_Chr14g0629441 [Helianthus annuus]